MEIFKNNTDSIILTKKFGVITGQEVILKKCLDLNKISFEKISRVNLIKQRVYYTNFAFFVISTSLLVSIFAINDLEMFSKMGIAFIASSSFLLSVTHKFYFYLLIIKLKNKKNYTIKSTQFQRDCMKEFYFSILKRVKKQKQIIFEKTEQQVHSA
ncbi:MAG: hypothetical protein H7239_07635 [Flavobacterium sp.]|nr:hypothetical protein [Flavobacterium sp.]